MYYISFTIFPATAGPELEQARCIAEKGKPILGEHSKLEVIIEESMTFKVHRNLLFPHAQKLPRTIYVIFSRKLTTEYRHIYVYM